MHISNRFVIVRNIQVVIRMLYHSFETVLLLSFFYLMVKTNTPFLFILSKFSTLPFPSLFRPPPPLIRFYLKFHVHC